MSTKSSKYSSALNTSATQVIMTVTYTYKACGYSGTLTVTGPCDSYTQSKTGEVSNNLSPVIEQIVFPVLDAGTYNFTITQHIGPCTCAWYNPCCEVLDFADNIGNDGQSLGCSTQGLAWTYTSSDIPQNCSPTDLQPQAFDNNSFQVLSEGQNFTSMDDCREPCELDIAVCPTSMPADCKYTFGVTGLDNSQLSSCLIRPVFGGIDICFNNQTNNWHFNISNLSVPIISTVCTPPSNWTDVGLGSDIYLLSQLITNCTDYNRIMGALREWFMGNQPCEIPCTQNCSSYYSSYASRRHENVHLAHFKRSLEKYMDDVYKTKVDIVKVDGECVNTAFERGTIAIQQAFDDSYKLASMEMDIPYNKFFSGREAWRHTEGAYYAIMINIKQWAKTTHSGWFDQFGNCVN